MARVSACATPLRRLLLGPPGTRTTAGGIRALGTSLVRNDEAPAYRPSTVVAPNMMDIGVRSIFNEDHDIFRKSVRKFFTDEVQKYHNQWEKDGNISRECWLKAGEQGLLGTDTPEEHGGIGGDFKDAAIIMEEQSYVNCSGPGFPLHSQIVMPYITHYGSPEQIEKFIPDMTAGRKIGAIAMTEPDAGSDLQGIRTNARQDGDDWILNGSKIYITNGYMSDVVIVVAITDPSAKSKAHGISLFLVEEGMPGFKKGCKLDKMGMKAQDTAELFFEDVRLPPSALLGKPNQGFYYLMRELPQERLLIGIMSCANCEWQLEETRDYLRNRKAFGKTLSNLQTIRHKMAELKTEICVSRAFTDQCIEEHSMKKLGDEGASMCKYWLSDLQNKVAGHCVQLFGGCGYMTEYPISRAYVDAKVQTIYGGSNEIMKELIARCIFR
ncbi:long-chain specific acyl-CoA dehydrogenase, mitochondrial-like [Portunus trituberculatus]|uniref:long-chain specific acyl-CoA dehydrogenase, mitochondrial-like n=1 Tax=Portunus trituberculatus TaxID=210409 RepID=UPI001E1CDDFE|nr:long-chain specific acyl-CoA dehydrogenase, mitochondrial-like [Portunus trituberculatus]